MSSEYNLDDILAEFSSVREESPVPTVLPEPETPAPAKREPAPVREEPVPLERPYTPKPKPQPQSKPKPQPKEMPRKAAALPQSSVGMPGILTAVFVLLSCVILLWIGVKVRPGSAVVSGSAGARISADAGRSVQSEVNALFQKFVDPEKIHFDPLDRYAVKAPAPSVECYGSVSIDRASEVMDIIQQARDCDLLGEQDVIFSPDIAFYHDSEIKYYFDESLLVICWKEVIDGNTCSCVEVKAADASQLRRKIADDAIGSPNQYYATKLFREANAVVAMNADFYQFRDFGIVVYNGELYRYNDANYTGMYSFYNCIDNCFVTSGGDFLFLHKGETISREELEQFIRDNDVIFSIAFGPVLVENGEVQDCTWYPAGEPTQGYSRAGIGIYDELHYFYMNLNHSPEKAARWTVNEFAQHMHDKGIDTAYGLDGGQTGEIVFNGEPYNYIDFGAERLVSDIIYFGTCIEYGEVE